MTSLATDWLTSASFARVYFWPFCVALGVTLTAVPIVRGIAVRLGLFDRPDAGLKPHEKPIPYLGGVGIYFGWLAALAWSIPVAGAARSQVGWIAAGGTVLMLTGLIDDIRHLPPRTRLVIQALVAGGLVYGGVGDAVSPSLLWPLRTDLPDWLLSGITAKALSWLVCAFVIAGATNSTNLIDGLDGLCGGVVAISSAGFLAINACAAGNLAPGDGSELVRSAVCVGAMGACLGFLVYNFNPASIFMGDSGSLLLGYNAALAMILFAQHPTWKWLAGAVMVFGFPIFDTALAITRRWLNGRPLFVGDRSHFYDQLRDRGLSVRQTVLVCYLIGLILAVMGAVLVTLPTACLVIVLCLMPVLAFLLCWRQGMLRVDDSAQRSG